FDVISEWKNTWSISLIYSLIISILLNIMDDVCYYETLTVLWIIIILLTFSLRITMLSTSYTKHITNLILLFIPVFYDEQFYFNKKLFSYINFTGLAILIGLCLIEEALMIINSRPNDNYASLIQGKRGGWIGQQQIKKLSLIPFFALIPSGVITPVEPYWPILPIGDETLSIIFFPFLIGYDIKVRTDLPKVVSKRIGRGVLLLAIFVILLAGFSYYVSWLSLAAVLVAIIGHEIINYRERMKDKNNHPYFYQEDNGLKVLGVIPNTPADRLGIQVGEKIIKVNDTPILNSNEF